MCARVSLVAAQGTMSHMAPEALLHGHISKAADVYAYGITLWELFTGGQAYQGRHNEQMWSPAVGSKQRQDRGRFQSRATTSGRVKL